MKIATAAAASTFLFALHHPPVLATLPATTLCAIAAQPEKWRGRLVLLTATYITDRVEYSLLKDDRCPKVWFGVFKAKRSDRASLENFDRAVVGDGRTIRSTRFKVEVIGRVSYRRDKGAAGRKSYGRVYVLKVLSYQEIERPPNGW